MVQDWCHCAGGRTGSFLVGHRNVAVTGHGARQLGFWLVRCHQHGSPFSRSYGGILPSSLTIVHPNTSVFYLTTCVGLGYGPPCPSLEAFLDSIGSLTSPLRAPHHLSRFKIIGGFAYRSLYRLGPGQPPPGTSCLPASLHRSPTTRSGRRPLTVWPEGVHDLRRA